MALSSVLECQASADNWPSSSHIHQWIMCRALYSFLYQFVGALVPTWRLGLLAVQWSFVVLPHPLLMTTLIAMLDGALFAFLSCSLSLRHPSHSLSHRQEHHPQFIQIPYVACYPICSSISNAHLSMHPVILAPYLYGRVP